MTTRIPEAWRRCAPIASVLIVSASAYALPPVPVPPENPITEPKRVLGKILFFDEQLSADNTVACATCHTFNRAGSDGRRQPHPGADGIFNTPDDVVASPGVVHTDALGEYLRDNFFQLRPQVTNRTANSPINSAFAPELFWDGRASSQFIDPETGAVAIATGGALESQMVNPPVSSVEMAHDGINWPTVTAKLAAAKPLALATALPADVATALSGNPSYGQLFTQAFGDSAITARRIAFAIATYERTLIADQSPFDLNTLTPQQQQGFQLFQQHNCNACHVPPLFTGNGFRNIGLRPPAEDPGRRSVTNNPADRGRFKVPSLRNVGLKNNFMHNGMFTTIQQVFGFYDRAPGTQQFPDNQDPVMATVRIPPPDGGPVQDLLANGLLDPRVRDRIFPFDQPTLYTQRPADRPTSLGGGVPGSGGIVPAIVAADPPMVGNGIFRIGLDGALGGATARLAISSQPPVNGRINPERFFDNMLVKGAGSGAGFATEQWPLDPHGVRQGQVIFAQWVIDDPAAVGGQSLSSVARIPFFCPRTGCPTICAADFNRNGLVSVQDIFDFMAAFFGNDPSADVNYSVTVSVDDLFALLASYFAGCN
jgi:cytochrome c peroxidase